jgi:hypothetical protein
LWINHLFPLNLDYDVVTIRLGKIFVFVGSAFVRRSQRGNETRYLRLFNSCFTCHNASADPPLTPLASEPTVQAKRLGRVRRGRYRLPMSPPLASSQPGIETPVLPGGLLFGYRCDMTGDQLPIVGLPAWL